MKILVPLISPAHFVSMVTLEEADATTSGLRDGTLTPAGPMAFTMADVERAQEAAMWVVVLAAAVLAAARFATYVNTVRVLDVRIEAAFAWWATYAIALGLVVVGLLGQGRTRRTPGSEDPAWLALLVGILVLVLMPASPVGTTALGAAALLARPGGS